MRIHLIAIGGAVMHNLALCLHDLGHQVTGSDDEIYDPARSRLEKQGLLPAKEGWLAERITAEIDLVILGMHAKDGNPELEAAKTLDLDIVSFPEFIGRHAKGKHQIVVAGSHGKTTTTSVIMHVLKGNDIKFDYLVGAQLEGYDHMVGLSDAPVMVIEGDEYLSSALDRRPKFVHYDPDQLIITGIAWDHMNVFPTYDNYVDQFRTLLNRCKSLGTKVFYDQTDADLKTLALEADYGMGYDSINFEIRDHEYFVNVSGHEGKSILIGSHNMKNIQAAYYVCSNLGVTDEGFVQALSTFSGAAKRMDLMYKNDLHAVYRDFAHAPSKVRATLNGLRQMYHDRKVVAICELHTYSSLNKKFLPQYSGALDAADEAIVCFSPKTLEIKKMPPLTEADIQAGFGRKDISISTNKQKLSELISALKIEESTVFLFMSSGKFGDYDFEELISRLT